MSSHEQWRDAYELAERMYKEERSVRRTDLDIYAQIVCARYDSIFRYDPWLDEYSFRNQPLIYEEPVASKCRPIACVDLEKMLRSTANAGIDEPTFMDLTPLHFIPPSTLLVFNHTQNRAYGLTNALDKAYGMLSARPTERDIQPGAEFVYKHKDHKCYRVLILAEVGETNVHDCDRRYEVAFLDVCQVTILKLKNLHTLPAELSLDRFPAALHCTRLIGVAVVRNGFILSYEQEIRKLYADKTIRKGGLPALVYKTDEKEQKLVVDFPSFVKEEVTESSALQAVHGHLSAAEHDPIMLSYQQLVGKVLLPLRYKKDDYDPEDSEYANLSSTSVPNIPPQAAECPFGKASIESYLKHPSLVLEVSPPTKADKSMANRTSTPLLDVSRPGESSASHFDSNFDSMDESMASFRSTTVTPKPTFDEPVRGESTPKKKIPAESAQRNGSPDGWGVDTPAKQQPPQVPPSPKKQPKPTHDEWGSEAEDVDTTPGPAPIVAQISASYEQPTVQRPLTRPVVSLPVTESRVRPVSPQSIPDIPLTPKTVSAAETFSGNSSFNLSAPTIQRPLRAPPNVKSNKDIVLQHRSSPCASHNVPIVPVEISPIKESPKRQEELQMSPPTADTSCPLVEESPRNQTIIEKTHVTPSATPLKEVDQSDSQHTPRGRKNGSSVGGSAVKSIKMSDMDDEVFEEQVPKPDTRSVVRRLSVVVDQQNQSTSTLPPRSLSSSSTDRLIHASQADLPTDEEDGWDETEKRMKKLKENAEISQETPKINELVVIDTQEELVPKKQEEQIPESENSLVTLSESHLSVTDPTTVVIPMENIEDVNVSVSNRSICPTVSDASDRVFFEEVHDEFALVPEALKVLADAFISSIQDAAFNKNRQTFVSEVYALELIALKSPGDTEQRFWKRKIEEAKILEPSFQ